MMITRIKILMGRVLQDYKFCVDQDFQGVCDDKPGFCAFLLTVSVTNIVSMGDNITTLKVTMIIIINIIMMIIMMIIRWAPLF